jgi:hypothetical protein
LFDILLFFYEKSQSLVVFNMIIVKNTYFVKNTIYCTSDPFLAQTLALILKISSSTVDSISDWFEEHERALTSLPIPDKNFTGYHADAGKAAWSCFQRNTDASVGKFCLLL